MRNDELGKGKVGEQRREPGSLIMSLAFLGKEPEPENRVGVGGRGGVEAGESGEGRNI